MAQSVLTGSATAPQQKVYSPSLSESFGTKCTSALIENVFTVNVIVLWQKVYSLSWSEFFGTKCTQRHCHGFLADSVSIVVVTVPWRKVWSEFFGTKCTYRHGHSPLTQSVSTVYRHCDSLLAQSVPTVSVIVSLAPNVPTVSITFFAFVSILPRLCGAWSLVFGQNLTFFWGERYIRSNIGLSGLVAKDGRMHPAGMWVVGIACVFLVSVSCLKKHAGQEAEYVQLLWRWGRPCINSSTSADGEEMPFEPSKRT